MAEIVLKIKQRYDTAARWTAQNPILLAGEIGIESDTRKAKVGDGSTHWNALSYAFSDSAVIPTKTSDLTNDSGFITAAALADYLPKSGGEITGNLAVDGSVTVGYAQSIRFDISDAKIQDTGSRLRVTSGNSYLDLYYAGGYPGSFRLVADDTVDSAELVGMMDGSLSWNGVPHTQFAAPDTSTFTALTLPSSGGTVTAPDDGYISLLINSTASGQYVRLDNGSAMHQTCTSSASGQPLAVYVPVSAGDSVAVRYSSALASSGTIWLRFFHVRGAIAA